MEDASAHSGIKFLAALNGICAGGGYELALACDEILLVDDGNSAVSLPETPLLGVLPGTGGLTRVVDKRKVRRDLADVFGTVAEGVKGKRAVEWRPGRRGVSDEPVQGARGEARAGAGRAVRSPGDRPGHHAWPARRRRSPTTAITLLAASRSRSIATGACATLTVQAPEAAQPSTPEAILAAGDRFWPLRAFRELDDALLRLRLNEPEIGTVVVRTAGDPGTVLAVDRRRSSRTRITGWFARSCTS